jgi:hypothetical protein
MAYGAINVEQMTTQSGYTLGAGNASSFKNRIINGAMVIDQRNAGASGTASAFTVDRWGYASTQSSKITWQQNAGSVTPPSGFTKYLGVTSSSAYSVLAGDTFLMVQAIEGFNVADFNWGSANAQTITLSFWVRSSLTGNFGGALVNNGETRSYPFTYTVNSANTWELKSITVAGDTTGTWTTDNTAGIKVRLGLGSGSTFSGTSGSWQAGNLVQPTGTVSVVGTNGATWYVTGVQLEVGTVATSFDYRPYGTELTLCQRYFFRMQNNGSTTNFYGMAAEGATTGAGPGCSFPVTMRAVPTATLGSGIRLYFPSTGDQTPTINGNRCSTTTASLSVTWTGTPATVGQAGSLYNATANGYIDHSAEL